MLQFAISLSQLCSFFIDDMWRGRWREGGFLLIAREKVQRDKQIASFYAKSIYK